MAFFSWPSQGTLDGYTADEASIEASEDIIAEFLVEFAAKSGASRVHIIAHSMGNRGLLRAVNRIVSVAQQRSQKQFDQIVLAAADVDAELFRKLSGAYTTLARRTTLYVSSRDRAVEASWPYAPCSNRPRDRHNQCRKHRFDHAWARLYGGSPSCLERHLSSFQRR